MDLLLQRVQRKQLNSEPTYAFVLTAGAREQHLQDADRPQLQMLALFNTPVVITFRQQLCLAVLESAIEQYKILCARRIHRNAGCHERGVLLELVYIDLTYTVKCDREVACLDPGMTGERLQTAADLAERLPQALARVLLGGRAETRAGVMARLTVLLMLP